MNLFLQKAFLFWVYLISEKLCSLQELYPHILPLLFIYLLIYELDYEEKYLKESDCKCHHRGRKLFQRKEDCKTKSETKQNGESAQKPAHTFLRK